MYRVLLRGANLVDPERGLGTAVTDILIERDRIVSIGPNLSFDQNTDVVDVSGLYACASLIDMHVHLTFNPRAHWSLGHADDSADSAIALTVQNMTEAALNGICLVRDVGAFGPAIGQVRSIAESANLCLPEVIECGPPLCVPGGHGSAFGIEVEASDLQLGRVVEGHRAKGFEWLKIMNGPELWPREILDRLVALAHDHDLRVAVHAFTPEGIDSAVRARADTVEHAGLSDPALAKVALVEGIQFVPTRYCAEISMARRFTTSQPSDEVAHLEYWRRTLRESMGSHLSLGLPVLVGTDAGCAPCSFCDIVDELIHLHQAGMRTEDVLVAATSRPADYLGVSPDYGRICVGGLANIILTKVNPLQDLEALRSPQLVILKGRDVVNRLGVHWC